MECPEYKFNPQIKDIFPNVIGKPENDYYCDLYHVVAHEAKSINEKMAKFYKILISPRHYVTSPELKDLYSDIRELFANCGLELVDGRIKEKK